MWGSFEDRSDGVGRTPPVLALAALPGNALGRLGERSTTSSAAWAAAGAAVRMLHDAPLPPWPGRTLDAIASELDRECAWLTRSGVVTTGVITSNRRIAEIALRSWTPVFTHGDLQASHAFVTDDEVAGVIDWSEAAQGDPLYDLATLTLGHPEHLDDVVVGYGAVVDLEVIRAWWTLGDRDTPMPDGQLLFAGEVLQRELHQRTLIPELPPPWENLCQ
ncbi:phosphotransferase [Rhodococcus erythropolis]|nr:phosphotransferase [Rhodococcus erythropolis]